MDQRKNGSTPRRKKRSQFEVFKENYLPAVIICIALLLIVIFVIGSITRSIQRRKIDEQNTDQMYQAQHEKNQQLAQKAKELMAEAETYAAEYDFASAIAVLDTFPGSADNFPELSTLREKYSKAQNSLVLWEDNSKVLNLSFQVLIADPARAFQDETYGTSYNKNFVTTQEFTRILQQLYENGYMLISTDDIVDAQINDNGGVFLSSKPLYLPEGKKPVILTQTQINYYDYMIDGDDDGSPDKDGAGFASRLLLDENGNLSCEIVNADGTVTTGAYDLVPILESFITTHPDFSYKGARATLAVTGVEGVFGYRQDQLAQAGQVIDALRNAGYKIACYTYDNLGYGTVDADSVNADLQAWTANIAPVLGSLDTFVFAMNSDISNEATMYSGEKFNALMDLGFKYYLGFCETGSPWLLMTDSYVRQGRILVNGYNMTHNPQWFAGVFDASTVLDPTRGAIPA